MIVKEQRPQDMRGIPIFDTVLIECRDIQMNLFGHFLSIGAHLL